MTNNYVKKTPLYNAHVNLNAKMVSFHDYEMPLQYDSIINEHHSVRKAAGLFDISHMGRVEISGDKALSFMQHIITNDVARLANNQALYTPLCNEHGGIIDDILVYRCSENHFMLVVNCSNVRKDLHWLRNQSFDYQPMEIKDFSDCISLIALQGPLSTRVLKATFNRTFDSLKRYSFTDYHWNDTQIVISRTGYTGEDGFELFVHVKQVEKLWNLFLEKNVHNGLKPIGLGARDTLRLEASLLLYGNDMDETITPLETTIGWTVKPDKGNFIGKDALVQQKAKGIERKLVGFEMIDRAIPRHGYPVIKDNEVIGKVTSGSFSPSTNKNIGLCLIQSPYATIGDEIYIQIRENNYAARIVNIPFYRRIKT